MKKYILKKDLKKQAEILAKQKENEVFDENKSNRYFFNTDFRNFLNR
jgi:hypothetical protein